ncbi:MAG: hypothetical protein CVT80_17215, partial [Alphaproteobacteria bacterium HGW-Alphaproteobacteria-2]
MTLDATLARIDADLPQALERLMALLRIPSVSTDPAHAADCRAAAEWLRADLAGGPHLLFYGHYDVQPADPLELWLRPPFEPAIEDTPRGRVIRARGASDDKGQLMTFVEACRAWVAVHGSLPCRLTMFFEGEEESGSPSLVPFMEGYGDDLRADLALICDTGLYGHDTPAIVTMLRGLVGEEVVIRGPARLPGFYDGVSELPEEIAAQWQALGFDAGAFLGEVGLSQPAGEAGRSPLEMIWSRPTAEVNGIRGGYSGAGFKTVLPAEASAKVSFRLVGDQDPQAIRAAFRRFVEDRLPPDCTVEFHEHGASPASRMATGAPAFEAARRALSAEWPREAAFVGSGGSIPVAGHFGRILGMDAMLIGFARDDDALHSPNE